jgi:hypothetical protein
MNTGNLSAKILLLPLQGVGGLSYDIVVKGHGGKIEVNSIENAGSEFMVQLPL